jgi:hypothetical protein
MGITLVKPPVQSFKMDDGSYRPNPNYAKVGELEHYFNRRGQLYNEYATKLIMRSKKNKQALISKASATINRFYDQIMIDEFQDFREDDFDLIVAFSKGVDNILLVGDYYQHSVSAINNTGKPFVKGKPKTVVTYSDFVKSIKADGFDVDETTLVKTRRCPEKICAYVTSKLEIEIYADNSNVGDVILVTASDIERVLKNDSIVKLVYENSAKYTFRSQNWSYSKGNTFSDVCVILTKDLDGLSDSTFSAQTIAPTTLNKLYVAMTRTKGNLYILTEKQFKLVKDKHLKLSTKP